jgi:hypothetical protein
MWLGDGAVFVSRRPSFDERSHEKGNPANHQNPMHFGQGRAVINMLKNVRA